MQRMTAWSSVVCSQYNYFNFLCTGVGIHVLSIYMYYPFSLTLLFIPALFLLYFLISILRTCRLHVHHVQAFSLLFYSTCTIAFTSFFSFFLFLWMESKSIGMMDPIMIIVNKYDAHLPRQIMYHYSIEFLCIMHCYAFSFYLYEIYTIKPTCKAVPVRQILNKCALYMYMYMYMYVHVYSTTNLFRKFTCTYLDSLHAYKVPRELLFFYKSILVPISISVNQPTYIIILMYICTLSAYTICPHLIL